LFLSAENSYDLLLCEKQIVGDTMQTRIKEYRARLNFTQEELAKTVGVRRETIVFLEQGKYNPSLKLAHDVAQALHTTIDDLFIFEEEGSGPEERTVLVD
jgi:putative transcriptional regulator